jgi:DNA invertase Pin-like site-specific DNA recombinase
MRRAREKGKALGRPKKDVDSVEFNRLKEEGLSMEEIAEVLGVSRATLFNWNGSLKPCSV